MTCISVFDIFDLTGINWSILYRKITGQFISRQWFILELSEELVTDYHEFLREEKENIQGTMSSDQKKKPDCVYISMLVSVNVLWLWVIVLYALVHQYTMCYWALNIVTWIKGNLAEVWLCCFAVSKWILSLNNVQTWSFI